MTLWFSKLGYNEKKRYMEKTMSYRMCIDKQWSLSFSDDDYDDGDDSDDDYKVLLLSWMIIIHE